MDQDKEKALIMFYKAWLNRSGTSLDDDIQNAIASIPEKEREVILKKGLAQEMTWARMMQVMEWQASELRGKIAARIAEEEIL